MKEKLCRSCKIRPAIKSRFESYGSPACIECRRAPKLHASAKISKNFKDPEAQPYKRKKDVPPKYEKPTVLLPEVLAKTEARKVRPPIKRAPKAATEEERLAQKRLRQKLWRATEKGAAAVKAYARKRRQRDPEKTRQQDKAAYVKRKAYFKARREASAEVKAANAAAQRRYKQKFYSDPVKRARANTRNLQRYYRDMADPEKRARKQEQRRRANQKLRDKKKAAKILDEILAPTRRK